MAQGVSEFSGEQKWSFCGLLVCDLQLWDDLSRADLQTFCSQFLPRSRNFGLDGWERERGDLAGGDRSCLAYRGVFKHRANDHKLSLGSGWSDKNGRDWEDWSFRERVAGECVTVTRYIHLQCSQGVIITLIWDREQSQAASICQYPSQHHTHNHHHNTQHTTQLSTSLYL